mmetsp:Transcript_10144/g.30425  ORF Transcript_10144/g.30425 Transcript_10144/m.30425 type:complete len:191 (+) Transcript_10144:366-938(+)
MSDQPSEDPRSSEDVPAAPAGGGGSVPGSTPGKKKYPVIVPPTPEMMMQEDLMNNCATRTVLSGVMGLGLGVLFGIFMGSMDATGGGMDGSMAPTQEKQTVGQIARQTLSSMRSRSVTYAKGFAAMGAMFAGSECVVEKMRAKHDIYNAAYAGCFTGGALGIRAGPQAACAGCATFAAFSTAIEYYLTDH